MWSDPLLLSVRLEEIIYTHNFRKGRLLLQWSSSQGHEASEGVLMSCESDFALRPLNMVQVDLGTVPWWRHSRTCGPGTLGCFLGRNIVSGGDTGDVESMSLF